MDAKSGRLIALLNKIHEPIMLTGTFLRNRQPPMGVASEHISYSDRINFERYLTPDSMD